ncbi:uncharacterized protein LOC118170933 [Oxyura jamaicensis]|uniref:uncharacterized protein LOC118170933 n=1 Tax=Oxyura jamaicensis TaxID=8884 RepID=UPI0015A7125B|nr:uncharacterized protein LOC118170933 [Oxyura jamaicensis]
MWLISGSCQQRMTLELLKAVQKAAGHNAVHGAVSLSGSFNKNLLPLFFQYIHLSPELHVKSSAIPSSDRQCGRKAWSWSEPTPGLSARLSINAVNNRLLSFRTSYMKSSSIWRPDSSGFPQSTALHISPGYMVYPMGTSNAVAFPDYWVLQQRELSGMQPPCRPQPPKYLQKSVFWWTLPCFTVPIET